MKTLIAISALAMGTTLGLQNPAPTPRGLTKVAPQAPSKTPQANSALTLDAWREQLTDANLAAREKAFDRLIAAARRDSSLRQALHDWSADANGDELAWTARLALRELDAAGRGAFGFPGFDMQGFNLSPLDPNAAFNPDEFFQQFEQDWPDANSLKNQTGASGSSSSSVESFSLSIEPDGVKCSVKRNVDGKEVNEEYTADSLDKLLEAHPELRDKLHSGDPFGAWGLPGNSTAPGQPGHLLHVDPFGWFGNSGTPGQTPDQQSSGALDIGLLRTDVLGVRVQPLSEDESRQLDLESGVGLRIESTEPGTIARRMGLQSGSVLIEMNGRTLKSRDDITEEIKKRGADGQIECVVIDRWGQHRTHTWKPDPGRQL